MANTNTDLCNQSQLKLGEDPEVDSIETPESNAEEIYAVQYDSTRKDLLRRTKPSFALKRAIIAASDEEVLFGYGKAYPLPSDCLKFLGIGEIEDKRNNWTLEGNVIYTDSGDETVAEVDDGEGGTVEVTSYSLKIRYIKDVTDVSEFNSVFEKVFALQLAIDVCESITGSLEKKAQLQNELTLQIAEMNSIDSQENPIARISRSKFLASRSTDYPRFNSKR